MAFISQGSTENIVLGEGYSPFAVNSNDVYLDSTSYILGIGNTNPDTALHVTAASGGQLKLDDGTSSALLTFADNSSDPYLLVDTALRLDANSKHITFFDKDGGSTDVGSVLTYSETASNQSKLKYNMNGTSYDENFVEIQMGATPAIILKRNEGDDVGAFFKIGSSDDFLSIGTGTLQSTKIFTGNNAVAEFTSSGKLILTEDTTDGATQLQLVNGAGDIASFAQNSDNQSLDITTDDFMLRLYSTEASGNVAFCAADGTRRVKFENATARFVLQSGLSLDTLAVSGATTNIANTDPRIIYLCDSSSNAITINLPAASDSDDRIFYIKDKGGAAGTNNITIDPNGSETIDGALTLVINSNYGNVQIVCDGSNWFTI